jgi:hypothetical protein
MDEFLGMTTPFIVLILFSVLIDRFMFVLNKTIEKIPHLPDKIEGCIAYSIILGISYLICWQGSYDLFKYLNVNFNYAWEGFLLSSMLVSGGSSFVKLSFGLINEIPSVLGSLTSSIGKITNK